MADVSDYSDAVKRIAEADVDPQSATRDAVLADLAGSDSPQITREVANNLADAVVTAEDVLEGLEGRGELPTSDDVERVTGALDDYDLDDRVDGLSDAIEDEVVLEEDVDRAVRDRQASTGSRPTFAEEVETAVDEAAEGREFVGSSRDEVADSKAREIGAPPERNYRSEVAQTIAQADSVTPADVVEGTEAQTPVQIVRDSSGRAVAATGGPSEEIGRQVAQSEGTEYLSTEEAVESMGVAGSGETVDLRFQGRKVGEVDVQ